MQLQRSAGAQRPQSQKPQKLHVTRGEGEKTGLTPVLKQQVHRSTGELAQLSLRL